MDNYEEQKAGPCNVFHTCAQLSEMDFYILLIDLGEASNPCA